MPENDERHTEWPPQNPRTIESLSVYVQVHIDSLRKDVKRVLAVIEERQIEKEVALLAERVKSMQDANAAQRGEIAGLRAEIDGAKKQIILWLIGWLVAIVFAIATAALAVVFKLKS